VQPVREPVPQFTGSIRIRGGAVDQRLKFGPVAHVRVIRDPGLHRGP
jgi:hypothetical protein